MATTTAKDDSLELLKKLQDLVEVGRQLTTAMEKAEPYLSHPPPTATASRTWVRPLPTTMDQVEQVLAVARHLAARTSAPAGWNPNAPVIGFTTPNPLPHQLRGGALGTLQLERARQLERDRKRQRLQKAAQEAKAAKGADEEKMNISPEDEDAEHDDHNGDTTMNDVATRDPKRRELAERQHQRFREQAPSAPRPATAQQKQQQQQPVTETTMNLSDSSSSSEEDDDD